MKWRGIEREGLQRKSSEKPSKDAGFGKEKRDKKGGDDQRSWVGV